MKQQFRKHKFQNKNLYLIEKISQILEEFKQEGIKVTLRQLYYQLVARGIIQNKVDVYNKLSTLLTDARYAGIVDWEAVEDRGRVPHTPNTFEDINDLIKAAAQSYQLDRWEGQEYYVELWTEKDALVSVISPITKKYQVSVCINKGYTSASSIYNSAQRFLEQQEGKKCILLYLGDHDASGLDMDRDIKSRLTEFGVDVEVVRIGLTMEQIQEYNPPENPAKKTDPRSKNYSKIFGEKSWEVDALRTDVLQNLIETSIRKYLDVDKYNAIIDKEKEDIKSLEATA